MEIPDILPCCTQSTALLPIAFPRQMLVAHISGGLPLPSAVRYDVISGAKLEC